MFKAADFLKIFMLTQQTAWQYIYEHYSCNNYHHEDLKYQDMQHFIYIYTGPTKKMCTHFNERNSMLYVSTNFNYTSQVEYTLQ